MTTAQMAYTDHQARIRALIDRLQVQLEKHADRAARQPTHWGFSGDLGSVESRLMELVSTLED